MSKRVLTEGWIAAYLDYTKDSEAPQLYHLWTGLSVLAGALRRNVWVDRVKYTIFPNLYVMLVGPTGTGKSAALNTGFRILRKVKSVHTFHGKISNEALYDEMNRTVETPAGIVKDGTIFIYADEVKSLLGERDYARELLVTLTDLYSGEDIEADFRTKKYGRVRLENYLINFLAGSTPSWLGECIRPSMFDGGTVGRILFVYQPSRKAVSEVDEEDEREWSMEMQRRLSEDLIHISKIRGMFAIRKSAREFWTEWRKTIRWPSDSRLEGYTNRKHDYALKIAMLLSISASDDLVIEQCHIEGAIQALSIIEPYFLDAFTHIGPQEKAIAAKIMQIIDRLNGAAPRKLLMKHVGHMVKDVRAFNNTIEMMISQGQLSVEKIGSMEWLKKEGADPINVERQSEQDQSS